MSKCPSCKSGSRKRISSGSLLKNIFRTRIYKCHECKVKYIRVPFLLSSIIIKKGNRKDKKKPQ